MTEVDLEGGPVFWRDSLTVLRMLVHTGRGELLRRCYSMLEDEFGAFHKFELFPF